MDLNSCLVNLCNGFVTYKTLEDKVRTGFFEKGIDFDCAILLAASSGELDLVKSYSSMGGVNHQWGTIEAVVRGHLHIVEFFIEEGFNDWNWALLNSIINNKMDMVKFFIQKGANNFERGIILSQKHGHKEIEDYLSGFIKRN